VVVTSQLGFKRLAGWVGFESVTCYVTFNEQRIALQRMHGERNTANSIFLLRDNSCSLHALGFVVLCTKPRTRLNRQRHTGVSSSPLAG
jgi:hypothetical protein